MGITQEYKDWMGDQAKANTMEVLTITVLPDGTVSCFTSPLFSTSSQASNGMR